MKKIIFGLAAVAMLAMGSCSKEQTATTGSNPLTDTISTTFGQYVGANLAMQCADFTPEQKVEFLRALQSTLTTPSGEAAERGTMVGAQMLQTVQQFASHDQIEINRTAMLDGFKEVFNMDSVDYTTVMKYSNDFQTARQSYLEQAQQARAAEAAGSPEAIQNGRIAADYINNLKAQDSSVQTSTSGLVFKIENPGQGEKPNANSTVAVKYTGRHLNGIWFQSHTLHPRQPRLRTRRHAPGRHRTQRNACFRRRARRHQRIIPPGHTNHTRGHAGIRHALASYYGKATPDSLNLPGFRGFTFWQLRVKCYFCRSKGAPGACQSRKTKTPPL